MFRYDRPQAGRYRQFWQFDVEAIGDPGPAVDAEIIELASRFFRDAGLADVEVLAQLDRRRGLPARLHRGADRVLPRTRRSPAAHRARAPGAQPAAPARLEGPGDGRAERRGARGSPSTCARRARDHFAAVQAHLTALGVAFRLDPGLVRGLDYYTRTAFEFYVVGARGPAAGARRRRPLRRARRAAGRPADTRDRVRHRPRPGAPRARGDRARRGRRPVAGRRRRRRRPGRHLGAAASSPRTCAPPGSRPGPSCRGASSASSSSRRPATGRISR